jgi:hypothetical protein
MSPAETKTMKNMSFLSNGLHAVLVVFIVLAL